MKAARRSPCAAKKARRAWRAASRRSGQPVGCHLAAGILGHLQPVAGQEQGPEEARHEVVQFAHAHGAERVAVVPAAQGAEAVAALLAALELGLEGHLQRHLHGRAAVVGEEGPGEVRGQLGPQPHHQIQGGLVGEAREHHMVELRGLALQGAHQPRVAVAVQAGPPARDAVQHPLAVGQQQVAALAAHHGHRRIGLVHLHLREGVPHMGAVEGEAIGPVGRQGRRHRPSVGHPSPPLRYSSGGFLADPWLISG